jgi:hypothetical protein
LPEAIVSQGDSIYIFVQTAGNGGTYIFKKIPVQIGVAENGYIAATPCPAFGQSSPDSKVGDLLSARCHAEYI